MLKIWELAYDQKLFLGILYFHQSQSIFIFLYIFCRYDNDVGSPLCADAGLRAGLRPHSADYTNWACPV